MVETKHLCSQVRFKVWFHVHLCITQIGNEVDSHCCPSKLMADLSPAIDAYLCTWLRLRLPFNSIERRLPLNCWFSQQIDLIFQLTALSSEITAIIGSPTLNCPKPRYEQTPHEVNDLATFPRRAHQEEWKRSENAEASACLLMCQWTNNTGIMM